MSKGVCICFPHKLYVSEGNYLYNLPFFSSSLLRNIQLCFQKIQGKHGHSLQHVFLKSNSQDNYKCLLRNYTKWADKCIIFLSIYIGFALHFIIFTTEEYILKGQINRSKTQTQGNTPQFNMEVKYSLVCQHMSMLSKQYIEQMSIEYLSVRKCASTLASPVSFYSL